MKKILTVITILALFISSCTSIHSTYSEVNPEKNLNNYKTYTWLPRDSSQIENYLYESQLVQNKIINTVNEELTERGFYPSGKNPDMLVQYTLVLDEQQKIINYPNYSFAPVSPYSNLYPTFPNYPYDYSYANDYPFPYNPYGYYAFPPLVGSYNYPYINLTPPVFPNNIYPFRPVVTGNSFQQVEFEEGSVIIDLIDRNTQELIWRGWSQGTFSNPVEFKDQVDNVVRYIFDRFPTNRADILEENNNEIESPYFNGSEYY